MKDILIKCPYCDKEIRYFDLARHLTCIHKLDRVEANKRAAYLIDGEEVIESKISDYVNGKGEPFHSCPTYLKNVIMDRGLKKNIKEAHNTASYKERHLKAIQDKYGKQYTNISQVPEIQKKKEAKFASKFGSYKAYMEDFRSKAGPGMEAYLKDTARVAKQQENLKKTLMDKYGVDNAAKIPGVVEKISAKNKERYAKMSEEDRYYSTLRSRTYDRSYEYPTSKVEKKVWETLDALGVSYQHSIRVLDRSVDVYVPERNLIIEINGDLWHAFPGKFSQGTVLFGNRPVETIWARDARKKKLFEDNGFRFTVIWEHTVRKADNLQEILEKIINGELDEA